MAAQRAKIGIKLIEALPPHSIIWDEKIRGFNARRQNTDVVTYSVFYRTLEGVQRWQRIGRHGVWTPDQARKEAQRVLRARDLGKDPARERHELRHGMSVSELADAYVADMEAGRINGKKASTIKSDKSRIATHIKPGLGKLKVVSVTGDHVEAFMNGLSPGSAKRVTGLLGAIFSYAVKKKVRADNPVHGVEKPKDVKRMRRLAAGEYGQLSKALSDAPNTLLSDIFTLLVITGWRSSEAKNLRWSELDLERRIATLGDTKTGVSARPLSTLAIEVIKRQPQKGAYVFEYQRGKPVNNLTPHWNKLGMPKDVTPHTLRHSFASLAADMGLPDSVIAGMLGHSRSSITGRYIHLEKALIEGAERVADETMRLMKM